MSQQTPGCLGWLLGFNKTIKVENDVQSRSPVEDGPIEGVRTDVYRLRDDFLSPAERSFFGVLSQIVAGEYAVFTKTRLGDLFYVIRPHENRSAFSRIASKHVDFVLCDPQCLRPLLGIELDDSSHHEVATSERDQFKDQVFAAAGLPLLRIPAQHAYQPAELRLLLRSRMEGPDTGWPTVGSEPSPSRCDDSTGAPICPKCGLPMTYRTARRGEQIGTSFWGCTNYPRCRQIIDIR